MLALFTNRSSLVCMREDSMFTPFSSDEEEEEEEDPSICKTKADSVMNRIVAMPQTGDDLLDIFRRTLLLCSLR